MNTQRFTQKSMTALGDAQSIATRNSNQQLEQVHLFLALLSDPEGLATGIFGKMGTDVAALKRVLEAAVERLPKVRGSATEAGKIYVSQSLNEALALAEEKADAMQDDYVSVEHLLLALTEKADATSPRF